MTSGHDVVYVDNFFPVSKSSIAHLLPQARLKFMRYCVIFPLLRWRWLSQYLVGQGTCGIFRRTVSFRQIVLGAAQG